MIQKVPLTFIRLNLSYQGLGAKWECFIMLRSQLKSLHHGNSFLASHYLPFNLSCEVVIVQKNWNRQSYAYDCEFWKKGRTEFKRINAYICCNGNMKNAWKTYVVSIWQSDDHIVPRKIKEKFTFSFYLVSNHCFSAGCYMWHSHFYILKKSGRIDIIS